MRDPDAYATIDNIAAAESPEEAARIGRAMQLRRPDLVRPDWDTAKLFVMLAALQAKVRIPLTCLPDFVVRLMITEHKLETGCQSLCLYDRADMLWRCIPV